MLKQQQPGSGGRKTSNGTSGPSSVSSTASGINSNNRTPMGRSRTSVKPPFQSSPVFEGVYNNARMLHFLTAVVGSTCDVKVKNGGVYEGIFKTLSSKCELAVDAVHKRGGEEGPPQTPPRREDITDTMIFSPSDLVTMICRDVDLNFATRDSFTDTGISGSRVNGEHREKVLQRWEGGEHNGETYDLENDASNGWDASEMFRFNEVNYGVKSTYDSSLSMYTVPLERGSTEGFRQREARAARLASEIESSPQYRQRVSLENEEGKSEEEKYSAVQREERERERGRESPGVVSREGKYVPLPQRAREMGVPGNLRGDRGDRGDRGPSGPPSHNRMTGGYRPNAPSASPRPPPASGPQPPPSERSSPLPSRGYGPNLPQGSPSPGPASPPAPHSHAPPHAHSDTGRPVNGVSRTSPKAQRPPQASRTVRSSNPHNHTTASRSPKSTSSQDAPPYLDTSSVSMPAHKTSGPALSFTADVNEILSEAAKERSAESPSTEDKTSTASSVQQRSQIEELRKFGKEFRLQPSGGGASAVVAPPTDSAPPCPAKASPSDPSPPPDPKLPPASSPSLTPPSQDASPGAGPGPDRQSPGMPQPARTPGSEEARQEAEERGEGVTEQVKKSTLNPNAKEFNPVKLPMPLSKPSSAPTPPRPTPPSPSVVLQHPGGQGPIYNTPYLSYVSQIHSVQPPQMYQYMSTVNQGKYPRAKGSVVAQRPDHGPSAPPMLQAAASAAGPPLVASPFQQPYLQYSPQYSQQQLLQSMTPYPGQMYSMLQGGARMLGQGGGHPQTMGPTGGPQFPVQGEGPPGPQQGLYAPQSFSHHSGPVHQPQPSSTPTSNQPPPQHTAPSPGQNTQSGPQPQPLYHSGPLTAPNPSSMPQGHTSPQASYPLQGYSLHGHQGIPHTYPLGQLAQAHVQGGMPGPHQAHGHPQVVMLQPPPQGHGSVPQHPQQGPHQHFYIPQAMQVPHPSPFHPPGN